MTSGLPFDDFRDLIRNLPGPDEAARSAARERSALIAGAGPSLGRAALLAEWLAAWTGRPPQVTRPMVALFAATHGVARRGGICDAPQRTQATVEHCAAGGAAISQACAAGDLGLRVFDLALDYPTGDIAQEPALDERACAATMAFGMEAIAGGSDLLCVGALSIAGDVPAAAILQALHGGTAADWLGGEPAQGWKVETVTSAVDLHRGHKRDPLEALRRLGGREIAAMSGAILAARIERVPVILDGLSGLAAAAALAAMDQGAIGHCMLGQVPAHPGGARAAEALGLEPLLDLALGEGEALGAAMAAILVRTAARVHSDTVPRA